MSAAELDDAAAAGSRSPEVVWRSVPADQFPLPALLALLFEPGGQAEGREGGDRRARAS